MELKRLITAVENLIPCSHCRSDCNGKTPQNKAAHEDAPLPEDINEKFVALDALLVQNSLRAKILMAEITPLLKSTALATPAVKLEKQIKRFDFKTARQTLKEMEQSIRP